MRRAEHQAETRRRIVEAAVGLHGTVGPLATTVSAIAERAGVERETVYRHFPDEPSLFAACTTHYMALHPAPSFEASRKIGDPLRRTERVVRDVYRYYAETEAMTASISRDAQVAPDRIGSSFEVFHSAARRQVLEAWRSGPGRTARLRAAIGHALRFSTWQSLVRAERLSENESVTLMARLIADAAR
jgi:AcrR family transcriptional regulator